MAVMPISLIERGANVQSGADPDELTSCFNYMLDGI